jgi:hypothetical protein
MGSSKANGWVFTLLGALVGAVVCGSLFCIAAEIWGDREQEVVKQEIQDRTARGEKDADLHVVMEHKTMPIVAAFGFFMELAVVCAVGGLLGGVVMSVTVSARTRNREVPENTAWMIR